MYARSPARVSTLTSTFFATNRLMVSGTIATRVSPGVFSLGTASFMGPFATEGGTTTGEKHVVAPPRGVPYQTADLSHKPLARSRSGLKPDLAGLWTARLGRRAERIRAS